MKEKIFQLPDLSVRRSGQMGAKVIDLYIANIKALSDPKLFLKYYKKIDVVRQEKVRQCKQEMDKKRSILAGYLIQEGVREIQFRESGLQADAKPLSLTYTFGDNGKPYLKEYPKIHFNLSHSGEYVLCALSGEEVGTDIQKYKPGMRKVAERFFAEEEKRMIDLAAKRGARNVDELFCRMWSIKEAYVKLTGSGLSQGMDGFHLQFEENSPEGDHLEGGHYGQGIIFDMEKQGKSSYFRSSSFSYGEEKYSIAVCSYGEIADIKIKEVILA